jgi:hypothetical protein
MPRFYPLTFSDFMHRVFLWLSGLLIMLPVSSWADVSLESLLRAYQERYKVSKANVAKVWPANLASEAAPEFPPDGFYARGVAEPANDTAYQTLRTQIIQGMYEGVNDDAAGDKLLDGWLLDGNLEGLHWDTELGRHAEELGKADHAESGCGR